VRYAWIAIAALLVWIAQYLTSAVLGQEIQGWLNRAPAMILRLAARRLPTGARKEYAEEWTGELAAIAEEYQDLPLTRRVKQAWYALGMLRAAGQIGRVVDGGDGALVTQVEQGVTDAVELAGRFLKLADPAHRMRWQHTMGGLLAVTVDRLSTEHAADVAQCMSDAGRADLALWWAEHWLRPERIHGRQPEDAVAVFRRLRAAWHDDPAELRDDFLRGIDHWSWASRQEVEKILNEEP
jgi:hypothetical protein